MASPPDASAASAVAPQSATSSASVEVRCAPDNALGTRGDSQRPSLGSRLSSLVGRRSVSSLGYDIVAVRPENCTARDSVLIRPADDSARVRQARAGPPGAAAEGR